MTDMKTTFLGLLLLTATAISAQEQARTFQLADAPRYSEETGYGYDLAPTPEKAVSYTHLTLPTNSRV